MIIYEKRDIGLKPRPITWEASVISKNSNVYLKISPGTVNNILPSNWASELEVTAQTDVVKYIYVKVMSQISGAHTKVTGAEFLVKNDPPVAVTPTINAPPPTYEILIGIFRNGVYRSIFNKPIFMYPSVFYTIPKENPEAFAYPFDKYYVWEVIS